jgi:hypothetical protein
MQRSLIYEHVVLIVSTILITERTIAVVPKVWGAPPWGAQDVRNYFIH